MNEVLLLVANLTQPVAKRLKLFGLTCLVGKIQFKLLSQGPLAE